MPISFKVKARSGYFVTTYRGHISAEDHILAFKRFFTGGEWIPDINELAIASEVKATSISLESLRDLIMFKNRHYEEHNVKHVKIAIYAPGDMAFGISRMYDAVTEAEASPEEVMAFRNIREAIRWLKK